MIAEAREAHDGDDDVLFIDRDDFEGSFFRFAVAAGEDGAEEGGGDVVMEFGFVGVAEFFVGGGGEHVGFEVGEAGGD